ncbi:hypothetical protein GCM10010272_52780 [Streptomyces lateritius]|nr:hypothetical protein GCM10010272_52780 [Streptomyces lateritius]
MKAALGSLHRPARARLMTTRLSRSCRPAEYERGPHPYRVRAFVRFASGRQSRPAMNPPWAAPEPGKWAREHRGQFVE